MPEAVETFLEIKERAFDKAVGAFLRKQLPDVRDQITRKITVDVLRDTMVGITTGPDMTPIRVDTGRYRAGWRLAGKAVKVKTPPATSSNSQPGDGSGEVIETPKGTAILVSNNVEYAGHVEHGTVNMRGGHHLARALILARRAVPNDKSKGSAQKEIARAWKGKK